jgi:hypothetical protein
LDIFLEKNIKNEAIKWRELVVFSKCIYYFGKNSENHSFYNLFNFSELVKK